MHSDASNNACTTTTTTTSTLKPMCDGEIWLLENLLRRVIEKVLRRRMEKHSLMHAEHGRIWCPRTNEAFTVGCRGRPATESAVIVVTNNGPPLNDRLSFSLALSLSLSRSLFCLCALLCLLLRLSVYFCKCVSCRNLT